MTALISTYSIAADKPEYNTSAIPALLQKNAKIVIRNNETIINVEKDEAEIEYNYVLSILNTNGISYTVFLENNNKFSGISDFHYTLYDGEGKKVKSYNSGDLIHFSGYSDYALYDDNRTMQLDPKYTKYPCTVEISYTKKIKSLLVLPHWQVFPDYNCAIEKSSLVINAEPGSNLRYYEKNMPVKVDITKDNKGEHYKWQVQNLEAFSHEDFEEPFIEFTPIVHLAPTTFKVEDTEGSFESWKEFGKWYGGLKKGRDVLSPETEQKIKQLTNGLDDFTKICKVYQYMQKRTRYVSIQVGIGGWQPFDAKTTDRLAYGDCKALTNYTGALLKAAGIKSQHVLINSGSYAPSTIIDFPSSLFNHVILSIPEKNDTMYLECTSPYLPAGHIGEFTDDRYAVMIADSGGSFIKTRTYRQDENVSSSNINIKLEMEGNSAVQVKTTYTCVNFDEIKYQSLNTDEDIKKILYKRIDIPNYSILSFSYQQPDSLKPLIIENIRIDLQNYITKMGNKAYLTLDLINKITGIPYISNTRKSKIQIRRYSTNIDSIYYTLPTGYIVDKLPAENNFSSIFGTYSSKCIDQDGKLLYVRKLSIVPGTHEIKEAQGIKDFCAKASKADMTRISIVKKQ
jgi:hypothetical protein